MILLLDYTVITEPDSRDDNSQSNCEEVSDGTVEVEVITIDSEED